MLDEIREQINAVVEAREKLQKTKELRILAYQKWADDNQSFFDIESIAKNTCEEAEAKLRGLALLAYARTGEKSVAPGIGIRVKTVLGYLASDALDWAIEHKLALKLDSSTFEKIAKTSNLPFVSITEEPTATIATELVKVDQS